MSQVESLQFDQADPGSTACPTDVLTQVLLDSMNKVVELALGNVNDCYSLILFFTHACKFDTLTTRFKTLEGQLEVRLAANLQDDSCWLVRCCRNTSLRLILLLGDKKLVA